jgi:hypothetical protein
MVQASGSIDGPGDYLTRLERAGALYDVIDGSGLIFEHVDDNRFPKCADVIGLASSGRIKGGLIEHDTIAAL